MKGKIEPTPIPGSIVEVSNFIIPTEQFELIPILGLANRFEIRPSAGFSRSRCREGHWLTIVGAGHNVQEDEPMALATTLRHFISRQSQIG